MASSMLAASLVPCSITFLSNRNPIRKFNPNFYSPNRNKFLRLVECRKGAENNHFMESSYLHSYTPPSFLKFSSIPLACCLAILLWSSPAHAGFLSGFSGIESVPGPQLPQFDFLTRFNEENQKKYAEADARFKESPLLKKLLEQSKLNKEKNRQAILDKYCIRGAEWGVGDCSAEAMSPEDRDKFISMLKQKAGVE